MFKVTQIRDFSGNILDKPIVRQVLAVDKASESFFVIGNFNNFIWIPIETCLPL